MRYYCTNSRIVRRMCDWAYERKLQRPLPANAMTYAFGNGADHILLGMFDFEIAEDVGIANKVLAAVKRERPWRS